MRPKGKGRKDDREEGGGRGKEEGKKIQGGQRNIQNWGMNRKEEKKKGSAEGKDERQYSKKEIEWRLLRKRGWMATAMQKEEG